MAAAMDCDRRRDDSADRVMANKKRDAAGPKGRAERLAAELRANLSRRKIQARERRENTTLEAGDSGTASDGERDNVVDRPDGGRAHSG
jgi:hypothetical protein